MSQRTIVVLAAWLEMIVGAIILIAPGTPSVLLFGTRPEGVGLPLARFAGVGLLALGIACLPSRGAAPRPASVCGLFVFNLGVAVLFAVIGLSSAPRGIMLWPAIVLHGGFAGALLPQLLSSRT